MTKLITEKAIIKTIKNSFPHNRIITKDSIEEQGNDHCWRIDSLNDSSNFIRGLNQFSTSIAFSIQNIILAGFVLNSILGELFIGYKGKGTELNGIILNVSKIFKVNDSLILTDFPCNQTDSIHSYINNKFNDIRCFRATTLAFCYLGSGLFDGFWKYNFKLWNIAIGAFIA